MWPALVLVSCIRQKWIWRTVEEEGPRLVSPESELDTIGARCSDVPLDRIRSVDHVAGVGLDQPEVLAVHVERVGVVIVAEKI
jgi:hypothetical protein